MAEKQNLFAGVSNHIEAILTKKSSDTSHSAKYYKSLAKIADWRPYNYFIQKS